MIGELNYMKYFSTLLHIEEIQMNVDIRKYDMWSTMQKFNSYLILKVNSPPPPSPFFGIYFRKVPGLAENRPSVMVGDSVFALMDDKEYLLKISSVSAN